MPAKNTQNDFQKQSEEIVKKAHSKKVYLMIAVVFIAIILGLLVGVFAVVKNYDLENKKPINDEITKSINQETENYYDLLEKKCETNCCLTSLKIMRENNYKKADKNGECPAGFEMNSLWCVTALKWCYPMEQNCAKEGELINYPSGTSKNLPDVCCEKLKGLFAYRIENEKCEILIGGPHLTCMPCGNGICETINGFEENKCNCPEDCGDEFETADWQIYRNEEFGLEFEYPKEWGNCNKLGEAESFEKDRGKTYGFSNSDFKLSFEKKGFEVGNQFYAFTLDRLPAHFGEIADINNYCKDIKKENNFIGLNLSCKIIDLGNQQGILRDDLVCVGSPTGGDIGCVFKRILLINNKDLEYPLFIINTSLGRYNYYESCDSFSFKERNKCFDGADEKYKEALEEHKDEIDAFNQILSTFKFTD